MYLDISCAVWVYSVGLAACMPRVEAKQRMSDLKDKTSVHSIEEV